MKHRRSGTSHPHMRTGTDMSEYKPHGYRLCGYRKEWKVVDGERVEVLCHRRVASTGGAPFFKDHRGETLFLCKAHSHPEHIKQVRKRKGLVH